MSATSRFAHIINSLLGLLRLRISRVPSPSLDPIQRALARAGNAKDHNTTESMDAFYSDPNLLTHYFTDDRLQFYKDVCKQVGELKLTPRDVIDVGCGTGHLLKHLGDLYPSAALLGIDFSRESIRIARELHPSIRFDVNSIFDLGRSTARHDLVLCTEVLEHLEDADQAFENLLCICSEGGTVVITVPNGREDTFAGHCNFWTPESFKREFKRWAPAVVAYGSYLFIVVRP